MCTAVSISIYMGLSSLDKMYQNKSKKAVLISGELHTLASGTIFKNGNVDYHDNLI